MKFLSKLNKDLIGYYSKLFMNSDESLDLKLYLCSWCSKSILKMILKRNFKLKYYLKYKWFCIEFNNNLHRFNDKPADIYSNEIKSWYKYGREHRDNDLPSVMYSTGRQEWWKNGVFGKFAN